MVLALLIACADPPPVAEGPRWPRAGDAAVIEVNAEEDRHGHATAWSASAWTEPPEALTDSLDGCRILRARPPAEGLSAVDLTAPATVRLVPDGAGHFATTGPLVATDARWAVGDVALVRDDGSRVALPGAVRFGDAPNVLAVRDGLGGGLALRWDRTADETLEVRTVRRDGQMVECTGGEDGLLALPAWTFDPAHPEVRVRAVRETLAVAPNEARVRVRAAVETVISLADPEVSERAILKRPARPTWEPRRFFRVRTTSG